jgi:hypothetical protein
MRIEKRCGMMSLIAALLLLGGCKVQWEQLLNSDHTAVDPNPPSVVTDPQFRLLIVEETADRPGLPADQLSIFTSTALRDYLDSHCAKLADGSKGYRIVDKDDTSSLPPDFQATAGLKRESTPWLYCTDGAKGLSCPLPASVDELLAKIRPYAER